MRNGEEPFARHTATHKLSQTRLSDIFLDDFRQLCRFVLFFFCILESDVESIFTLDLIRIHELI